VKGLKDPFFCLGFDAALGAFRADVETLPDSSNRNRLRRRVDHLNELFLSVVEDLKQAKEESHEV